MDFEPRLVCLKGTYRIREAFFFVLPRMDLVPGEPESL